MKRRLPLLFFAVLFGSLGFGLRGVQAQGKTNVPRIEERLFLMYALESLAGTQPWAYRNPSEHLSVAFARFQTLQRREIVPLRQHTEKRKHDDILSLYQGYEKELDLIDDFWKTLDKSLLEYEKKVGAARSAASSRMTLTGLGFALRVSMAGEDDSKVFLQGMNTMMNRYLAEQRRLFASQVNSQQELGRVTKEAMEKFSKPWNESHDGFTANFEKLATDSDWKDAEFAFQIVKSKETPTRNPFLLVAKAQEILKKKDATVKEMIEQAEVCQRAAGMVPADRSFSVYRAAFLGAGGRIANRAASKDIAITGFPLNPKTVSPAAKQAYKIWNAYVKLEPYETNYTDEVVHACFLASAQAGNAKTAYAVIYKTALTPPFFRSQPPTLRLNASSRPEFWYDCARVCAVVGNTRTALDCLVLAVKLGWRDKEAVKVHPDLRNVREDRVTADRFKRLFP
ncbi:MAG TPA: hypothetical protein VN688_31800 [Gemmataceae bacterium]|nr:hypothetical protein [Gemmataceae bacterium]